MKPNVPESAAGVHKDLRAENIRAQKYAGVGDRTVNMTFRGKIDDSVGFFLLENAVYRFTVADIRLNETEIFIVHKRRERLQIAAVGQLIKADNAPVRMFV